MKANELMIGDWVSLSETGDIAPCVVTVLHPKELFVLQPEWSAGEVFSYDTIYPIPLTPEILEKNGFEKHFNSTIAYTMDRYIGDVHIWVQFYKEKPHLGLQKFGAGTFELHCYLNHIHELQHALRLCGLNDLAENFQV